MVGLRKEKTRIDESADPVYKPQAENHFDPERTACCAHTLTADRWISS